VQQHATKTDRIAFAASPPENASSLGPLPVL
jgi:hypothetical protein